MFPIFILTRFVIFVPIIFYSGDAGTQECQDGKRVGHWSAVSGQLRTIRIAPKKAMTCQTETLADLEGRWLEQCSNGTGRFRTGGQWNRSANWTQLD